MVALVTPISIFLAVAQAAIDKNRLDMNVIGVTVSKSIQMIMLTNRLIIAILCPLIESLRFLTLINYCQTAFFSALLLTALGAILNYCGDAIVNEHTQVGVSATPAVRLQFSGAFIATLFWVILQLFYIHCTLTFVKSYK